MILLYHFGPLDITAGQNRVISSFHSATGSRFYVVAHRTKRPIEAYEINLYKVDDQTNVFWYYLGHQESFWWGCSLKQTIGVPDELDIRSFWQSEATYLFSKDLVVSRDSTHVNFPAQRIDSESKFNFLKEFKSLHLGN